MSNSWTDNISSNYEQKNNESKNKKKQGIRLIEQLSCSAKPKPHTNAYKKNASNTPQKSGFSVLKFFDFF
jgi:hypothetical protein